jgi:hypothetical protein
LDISVYSIVMCVLEGPSNGQKFRLFRKNWILKPVVDWVRNIEISNLAEWRREFMAFLWRQRKSFGSTSKTNNKTSRILGKNVVGEWRQTANIRTIEKEEGKLTINLVINLGIVLTNSIHCSCTSADWNLDCVVHTFWFVSFYWSFYWMGLFLSLHNVLWPRDWEWSIVLSINISVFKNINQK